MADHVQKSPVALVVALVAAALLTAAVAAVAGSSLPGPERWPSQLSGDEGLAGLVVPPFDNPSPVGEIAPSEIIETEWPLGSGEFYAHPTVIARYIHGLYATWLREDLTESQRASMRVHADYLARSIDVRESRGRAFGSWLLPMPNEEFGVGPGWTSGFTNAAGALALEQAATVFPERSSDYREAVSLALASFEVPVSDGGVITESGEGACIEEVGYPAEPTCILNGHIFAMGYLYSLARGSAFDTRGLLETADRYIRNNLADYSTPFASKYSPQGKYAEPDGYNHIHGAQMLWLYAVTGNRDYYETAVLWSQFDGSGSTESVEVTRSVDIGDYGPEMLIDGPAWYGYWSAGGSATIISNLVEFAPVCGFNVFYVDGAESPIVSAAVGDGEAMPVTIVAQDLAGEPGYETLPTAYRFDRCVPGGSLRLELSPGPGGVVAVRELDVVTDSDNLAYARLRDMYAGRPMTYRVRLSLRAVGLRP